MLRFFLNIDEIDGDVTETHHRNWHELDAYIISDDDRPSPANTGNFYGAVHVLRLGTNYDQKNKNAGLRYLKFELFASKRIQELWRHGYHKKKKSDNAVLALSTEAGADLWRIEFSDVKIMGFGMPMDPSDPDLDAQAKMQFPARIMMEFKTVAPDLTRRY